jgi:hypothetical protein
VIDKHKSKQGENTMSNVRKKLKEELDDVSRRTRTADGARILDGLNMQERLDELTRRVEQLESRQPKTVLRANTVLVHDLSGSVFRDRITFEQANDLVEWDRAHANKRLRLPDYDEVYMSSGLWPIEQLSPSEIAGGPDYDAILALCKAYKQVIFYTDEDGRSDLEGFTVPVNLSIYVF